MRKKVLSSIRAKQQDKNKLAEIFFRRRKSVVKSWNEALIFYGFVIDEKLDLNGWEDIYDAKTIPDWDEEQVGIGTIWDGSDFKYYVYIARVQVSRGEIASGIIEKKFSAKWNEKIKFFCESMDILYTQPKWCLALDNREPFSWD